MLKFKLVFCFIVFNLPNFSLDAKEIWVTTDGNDLHEGTQESPLASIEMALRRAREWRRLGTHPTDEPIVIQIEEGIYYLDKPILIRPEDSGTSQSPTILKSAHSTHAELSAGKPVRGWKKSSANPAGYPRVTRGKLWEAPIPKSGGKHIRFRQLWINGQKANRASNLDEEPLSRILGLDKNAQEMYIPHPGFEWEDGEELEFVIHQWWAIANLRVKAMERDGNRTKLTFHQPESQIEFEHPWPAPFLDKEKEYQGNSAFYFSGAKALLNNPGEWYADYVSGNIYYWPKEDQDMSTMEAVVPFLENVVDIRGTRDHPVSHVYFEGLKFSHATWLRPSNMGHVPLQAGWSILEAYTLPEPGTPDKAWLENQAWIERQPAAFEARYATDLKIERCLFTHHAATGLDLVEGISHTLVEGNVFKDIGGTGIQAGFFGGPEFEAHLPYNPSDKRELVGHVKIHNNLISDATNEDWGCVGISVGFAHDVDISHNEIREVNYSGICVGWGWTRTISASKNNRVHANKIHRFAKQMYDVGGIYTLSAQPNMQITENVIYDLMDAPYAHMPHHHQYIYLDEGSSYILIKDNWTERDKFFSNRPGPGVEWQNNGPEVSDEIKAKAGIQAEFQDILKID